MLKRKQHQNEKEKEKGFIQKIKKIRDIDGYTVILIMVPILLVILLSSYAISIYRTNKKAVDKTVVQNQVVTQQNINKKEEIILNETYKLNKNNFEIYISKKNESKGLIFIRPSDFIKNNNKVDLSESVRDLTITGNSDILSHLSWSLSKKYYVNVSNNNINITFDNDNSSKSELLLKINTDLISKEQIINDAPLIQVRYIESYAD